MSAYKFTLPLVLFLVSVVTTAQQINDFDLRLYTPPDVRLHALEFGTRLQGESNNISYNRIYSLFLINDTVSDKINDTVSDQQSQFRGHLSANYHYYGNSQRFQISHYSSAGLLMNSAAGSRLSDDNIFASMLEIRSSSQIRLYFTNGLYTGITPELHISHSPKEDIIANNLFHHDEIASFSMPIVGGFGRIEQVQDAAIALHIVKELYNGGFIIELPSDEVILMMAQEITLLKNKRFFDTRQRRIEELKVINRFLTEAGLLSKFEIEYAAILNDIWGNAPGQARKAGFRTEIAFYNLYRKDKEKIWPGYGSRITQAGPMVTLIYARPINLYWQTYSSITTMLLFEEGEITDVDYAPVALSGNLSRTTADYTIDYRPDTRTSVKLILKGIHESRNTNYRSESDNPQQQLTDKLDGFSFRAQLDASYYFSQRLRGYINLKHNFHNQKSSAHPFLEETPFLYDKRQGLVIKAGITFHIF